MSRVLPGLSKPVAAIFGAGAQAAAFVATAGVAPAPATGHPFAAPQSIGVPAAPGVGGLAQVTMALLIVLVTVFAVAWVAKRVRGFGNRVGNAIDVIADIPLGQKERAVLLKVGQAQILVGVAPGRVNTLHVLAQPIDLSTSTSGPAEPRPTFKSLMMRSLGK